MRPLGLLGTNIGKAVMTTPFNANLHPRAAGGKFGQANNPKAAAGQGNPVAEGQAEARRFKAQLLQRAKQDDVKAAQLRGEEHQLRVALAAAKTSKTHTVAKKSSAKTPAGSKSGLAKKTPKASAKKTAAKTASKTPSIPGTATGIQSRLIIVTGTIHALEQDAKKCRSMAAKL